MGGGGGGGRVLIILVYLQYFAVIKIIILFYRKQSGFCIALQNATLCGILIFETNFLKYIFYLQDFV